MSAPAPLRRVTVFSGSRPGARPSFAEDAARLGRAMAARGVGLVYGGASVGLMGVLADAALAAGGEAVGVIPRGLARKEIAHAGLTELRVVETMHERKAMMADLSDGFIALPGGFGTMDELAEALTWTQLGLQCKPVVLLDVDGFWEPLVRFFDAAVDHGFVRPAHRMLLPRTVTVDDAIALATSPVPDTPHKWLDRDGTR